MNRRDFLHAVVLSPPAMLNPALPVPAVEAAAYKQVNVSRNTEAYFRIVRNGNVFNYSTGRDPFLRVTEGENGKWILWEDIERSSVAFWAFEEEVFRLHPESSTKGYLVYVRKRLEEPLDDPFDLKEMSDRIPMTAQAAVEMRGQNLVTTAYRFAFEERGQNAERYHIYVPGSRLPKMIQTRRSGLDGLVLAEIISVKQ